MKPAPRRLNAAWICALLFGAALATIPLPVLADDDGPDDTPSQSNRGQGSSKRASGRDDGVSAPRNPGRIQQSGVAFDGRYIDFQLDRANCTIRDYRLYNQSLFSSIELPGPCDVKASEQSPHGAVVRIEGDDAKIVLHDSPNGLVRAEVGDGTVTYTIAAGVGASVVDEAVELSLGDVSARLWATGDGDLTFSGAMATLLDGEATFLAHPLQGMTDDRRAIRDGIRDRRIGGEIDVLAGSIEPLAYDNVTIKVSKKSDSEYRFVVDANLTEGRVFVVNLVPGAFASGNIGLRYYDEDDLGLLTEVPILESDDVDDLLDLAPGEGPEYWFVQDAGGRHVLVAVPEFSVHVFDLLSIPPQIVPLVVYGVVFALVFVAIAAVGLFMGRKP